MKNRGFTLIELLVVIAIIAILVAMIMPVMLQAKDMNRMRNCAQNMRQLGMAIQRYVDDNDGYSIPQKPRNEVVPEHPRFYKNPWVLCVEPLLPTYLSKTIKSVIHELPLVNAQGGFVRTSPKVLPKLMWICPGDILRNPAEVEYSAPFWWHCGSSYMYPGPTAYLEGTRIDDNHKMKPRRLSLWKKPARDMLLADYWPDFHTGKFEPHEYDGERSVLPKHLAQKSQFRNFNILFLDMHMGTATLNQRMDCQNNTSTYDNPYWDNKSAGN